MNTCHQQRGGTQRQRGFTLVEFMVAMLLGTILIGGAVAIYLASNRSYQETERSIAMLDSGRFSLQLITDSLRHAGFFGGVPAGAITQDTALGALADDCSGSAAAYDINNYLFAVVADGSGNAVACIDDARPGTDVLVIKYMLPDPLSDTEDPNAPGDGVISWPTGLDAGQTYIVANANAGLLMDGADTPPNVGDGQEYARGMAWPYMFQAFYVRQPDNAVEEFRLASKTLRLDGASMNVVTEDLAEGVEDLRVRFRYDSDGDGEVDTTGYAEDLAAADWANVGSVEVFMLVRSQEQDFNYDNEKAYVLGDRAPVGSTDDSFWRMLVTRYVALRNPNLVIQAGGA
ncbi:MAG: hypothetical protein CME59_00630 [Halioglobus sp.]|nr:hypothetical protein [Halioglobus sp.]|tara:strand:- start:2387 stop:3421 length:1035 start_codon:yes stop_codon:yes gene_type:complete